jgi:hypothetical protein
VTVAIRPIGDRNVFVNRRRTRVVPSELLLTASTLPEGFQTSRFEYPLPAQGGELGYGFRWSAGDYQLTVHHDGPVVQCAGARSVRIRSTVGSVCGRDRDPSSDLVATWSEHGHRISVQIGPMGLPDVDPYEMADLLGVVEALVPAT